MGIVFTRAWEDDRLDAQLLAMAPGERAFVIAGSGDTALALAADGGQVVAVDRNPDQLRLARLKLAAARVLPPTELHAWFEVGRAASAGRRYREVVRARLSADDAAWWDQHIGLFERGLHTSTGVGRPLGWLGKLGRLTLRDLARQVETVPDVAAQAVWWQSRGRRRLFGPFTHWFLGLGPVLGRLAPDPRELARLRGSGWSRGLEARVDAVVGRVLIREHPWWRPPASGRAADQAQGAAWLDVARCAALADADQRIVFVEDDVVRALGREAPASLMGISLSNVLDWLDPVAEEALAGNARRALAPGGRLLARRVVASHAPDPFLTAGFRREAISDELPARDRTALYEAIDLYRAP
jgi:S-adenosylmethionine:diacylglycerol 3-amino-3-carboxypropyl transferase